MKKSKLTLILQLLLIISILALVGVVAYDYYEGNQTEKNVDDILKQLDDQIVINISEQGGQENQNNTTDVQVGQGVTNTQVKGTATINNYVVYGKIEISSVGLKYPILEYNASTLKNSICNLSGKQINGTGNLCIAGHNTSNGTLFGKLKKVKCGDIIEITNVYGKKYKYIVYSITAVEPNDNSLLGPSERPIVTLITCTNSAKQRLIVQGQLLGEN